MVFARVACARVPARARVPAIAAVVALLLAALPLVANAGPPGAGTLPSGGTLAAGQNQPFSWDGKDSSGNQLPDGNYKISVTATDSTGQTVAIPTQIEGIVDSADLTQSPPTLSIAGQDYTLDKLKRVVRQ